MKEATRIQIENMKNQTFGVEIEGNNITRQKAAEKAAAYFGTGRSEYTAHRNGYMTWSAWDAQGREWKFQRDVSIEGPDDQKCEMVTPILTYADMELLQGLVRILRKAGMKSDAGRGCGVHIHIGAKGHTPQTIRNLVNIMASHESQIAKAIKVDSWRQRRYCRRRSQHLQTDQPEETLDHEPACGCLVRKPALRVRKKPPLQRQPVPHAQPPRDLHEAHD